MQRLQTFCQRGPRCGRTTYVLVRTHFPKNQISLVCCNSYRFSIPVRRVQCGAERVKRFEPRSRGLPGRVTRPAVLRLGRSVQKEDSSSPFQRAFSRRASRDAKAVAWKHAEARSGHWHPAHPALKRWSMSPSVKPSEDGSYAVSTIKCSAHKLLPITLLLTTIGPGNRVHLPVEY
jgi:hypothetical protein